MAKIEELFGGQKVWTRRRLAAALGTTDRQARKEIEKARRNGIPIVALPGGGYKIAETPEEKSQLLQMYLSRATNEFKTYHMLRQNLYHPKQMENKEKGEVNV